jgi:microcystin-dependent protein
MSDYFVGEIRIFPYQRNRIPSGWLPCDGTLLNIQGYSALYSLLGTAFGGDGRTTFALPDLRGRTGIGRGIGQLPGRTYQVGQAGGVENAALTAAQTPAHIHAFTANTGAGTTTPIAGNTISSWGASLKVTAPQNLYATPGNAPVALNPATISVTGSGAGHNNMQPFEVLIACIASNGLYPSRP